MNLFEMHRDEMERVFQLGTAALQTHPTAVCVRSLYPGNILAQSSAKSNDHTLLVTASIDINGNNERQTVTVVTTTPYENGGTSYEVSVTKGPTVKVLHDLFLKGIESEENPQAKASLTQSFRASFHDEGTNIVLTTDACPLTQSPAHQARRLLTHADQWTLPIEHPPLILSDFPLPEGPKPTSIFSLLAQLL